ncbi:helix-turn-helix domain-containing protein [Tropicimonas sp. IMCC6043]|uniref:helix-turn-helix domain-containing protein n=1 Tax=Tropicimonas sp. IMCC6043 TaxID=2510645 RepID=UPI00101DAF68|nr:AraC family transcriptional regulator [Tropicimonas sp. IMCC6043]
MPSWLAKGVQTFRALRNEEHFSVARKLLEPTNIPIVEIGAILGVASLSVFTEAFLRLSGTPPTAWRTRSSDTT